MDVEVQPGNYVLAVSGGVDSVVLMDMLALKPHLKFVVAHFDHGIRQDSLKDRQLVQRLAKNYNLSFVYDEGHLGPGASEEVARQARYRFLRGVMKSSNSKAIITAHHQDDLLETAIINLVRGTGRKGLSSLNSKNDILRPLLQVPKADLINYARNHNLTWHEDSSNQDTRYLRNHIRHKITPAFKTTDRQKLLDIITNSERLDGEIEELLIGYLHLQPALNELDRHWFIMLPNQVALETMARWLRKFKAKNLDKKLLQRTVTAAKTFKPGKLIDVDLKYYILVSEDKLALTSRER